MPTFRPRVLLYRHCLRGDAFVSIGFGLVALKGPFTSNFLRC